MKLRHILSVLMSLVAFSAFAQPANINLNIPSFTCTGTTIHLTLPSPITGCTTPRIGSSVTWTVTPTPASITYGTTFIDVKWNSAVTVHMDGDYTCSGGRGGTAHATFTVGTPVTPTVSLSLSSSTICAGTASINLTTTSTNGGTPSYKFYYTLGSTTTTIYQGPNSSATFTTSSLAPGTYTVTGQMTSSNPCATLGTVSSSQTLTVNVNPSVGTLTAPSSTCEGSINLSTSALSSTSTQWQTRSSDDGGSSYSAWGTFSTVNTSSQSYTVSAINSTRIYQFKVVAQTLCGTVETLSPPSVTVYKTSSTGTLSVSQSTSCGPTIVSLTVGAPVGSVTYQYHYSDNGGAWSSWTGTSPSAFPAITPPTGYRTYEFQAFAQNGVCLQVASNIVSTTAYANTSIGTFSIPQPYYFGSQSISVVASALVSSSTSWTYSYSDDNGATYSSWSSFSTGNTSPQSFAATTNGMVNRMYRFQLNATNGICSGLTSPVISVTVFANSVVPMNYHRITDLLVAGYTTSPDPFLLNVKDINMGVQYRDGLGRLLQTVAYGESPTQKDLVIPMSYDNMGRAATSYMPFGAKTYDGLFKPNALIKTGSYTLSDQYGFYNSGSNNIASSTVPYANATFDNSPISRTLEQGAPGSDWQPGTSNTVRTALMTNSIDASAPAAIKNVRLWNLGWAGPTGGPYATDALLVTKVTDENGHEVYIFTDKKGQTILKRVQVDDVYEGFSTSYLETYFVYDERGRLVMQVPPKAIAKLNTGSTWNSTFYNDWCFLYTYDGRNRLVEKKMPGMAATYFVYDDLNRLCLMQDGNLRATNKWLFVKYDHQGRTIMNGLYTNTTAIARTAIQSNVDVMYVTSTSYPAGSYFESRGTALHGYTNVSFPSVNNDATSTPLEVWNVSYYDGYDFDFNGTDDFSYTSQGLTGEASQFSAFGKATGSKKIVLGTSTWLYTYVFYDKFGRPIQSRKNNHLSNPVNNLITNVYDFEGKLLTSKNDHNSNNGSIVTILSNLQYDHAGRLLKVYQNFNGQPGDQLVAQYVYNELGQLVDKKLHYNGTDFLQSIDLRYNIRGWLTSINNAALTNDGSINDDSGDYFGMELSYNTLDTSLGNSKQFNGNVSAVKWKGIGAATGDGERRAYKFDYSKNDQLKQAQFAAYGTAAWDREVNTLNEVIQYDANGNIKNMERRQNRRDVSGLTVTSVAEVIDMLTYTYTTGNQLDKVEDTGTTAGFLNGAPNLSNEYTYDQNGNTIGDKNKNITSIEYNSLNKVKRVVFSDGRIQTFVYDGTGMKLQMKMFGANGVLIKRLDYVNDFQYENAAIAVQPIPEGRVARTGSNLLTTQADCDVMTGFSAKYSTLSNVTQNGETYLKVVSTNGGNASPGVLVTNWQTVQPQKRYIFRVKGYVQSGAVSQPTIFLYSNLGSVLFGPTGPTLPIGAANEDWVSFEFVTAPGTTILSSAIYYWDPAPIGQEFYLNKVELTQVSDEYQYMIADQQGNTRVLFSSVSGTPKVSTANMESTTNSEFPNYSSIFRSSVNLFDHTDAYPTATNTYSNLLNGGNNQQIGIAKSYQVYPGDKVKIEAFAKYSNPTGTSSNLTGFASAILSAFGAGAPIGGETGTLSSGLNNYGGVVAGGNGPSSSGPKAFVNILIFDKNYKLLDIAYKAIDPAAQQVGVSPVVPFDAMSKEYIIKEAGYAFLYVSNESPTLVDVYFDDVVMTYTPGNVIQYNEYYPFGMRTASSWDRVDAQPGNNYLYNNGSEFNSNTNWYETTFRGYDPALGRFLQMDPMAATTASLSPYHYANNNPVLYNDPAGLASRVAEEEDDFSMDDFLATVRHLLAGGGGTWSRSAWEEDGGSNSTSSCPGCTTYGSSAQYTAVPNGKGGGTVYVLINQSLWSDGLQDYKGQTSLSIVDLPNDWWESFKESMKSSEGMDDYPLSDRLDFANDIAELVRQGYGYIRFGTTLEQALAGNPLSRAGSAYKTVGKTFVIAGAAVAIYQFADSDYSGGDWAKLGVNATIIAVGFVPVIGPFLSIGLGIAENMGAFDGLYKAADGN